MAIPEVFEPSEEQISVTQTSFLPSAPPMDDTPPESEMPSPPQRGDSLLPRVMYAALPGVFVPPYEVAELENAASFDRTAGSAAGSGGARGALHAALHRGGWSGWGRWRPRIAALLATACVAFAVFVDASTVVALAELQQPFGTPLDVTNATPVATGNSYSLLGFGPHAAWFYSLVPFGAMFGSLPVGSLSERIGRKLILFVMGGLCCVSWPLVIVIRKNVDVLYAARFVAGIAMGSACVLHPMYVSEIADARERGALGMLLPMVTSTSYLLSDIAAAFLYPMWAIVAPGAIPLVLLIAFAKMPESPRFLVNIGFGSESVKAVRWLRGQHCTFRARSSNEHEMENLNVVDNASDDMLPDEQLHEERRSPLPSTSSCGNSFCFSYSFFIALFTLILRPLTGAMLMHVYMETTLNSKVFQNWVPYGQLIVGVFELGGIMLGAVSVDRIGRLPMLLTSSIGSAICYALLGSYFTNITDKDPNVFVSILAALFLIYGFGFLSVPWVIIGEIIPTSRKGCVSGIASCFHWLLTFIIINGFPHLISCFTECVVFSTFGAISIVLIIIVCKITTETYKKSLDQIQKDLQRMYVRQNNNLMEQ